MFASVKQYAGDGFLFNASDPLNASDAVAFKHEGQDQERLIIGQIHIAEKPFLLLLKSSLALVTAIALDAFAVFAGFLCFDFAVVAGHYEP
jgi:hypothetical protein